MRNIFKKTLAGIVTTALVATMAVGMNVGTTAVKAEIANAITEKWVSASPSYEPNDAIIANNTFTSTADSITANIVITGWQANWVAESAAPDDAIVLDNNIWGEKPYQITSTNTVKIVPGNTYKLKFTVENGMKVADAETPTEKNITITINSGIEGDNDNTMLFKTVTVPASATQTFEFDVPISAEYLNDTVQIQFAYGSYAYSYKLTQAVKSGEVSEEAAKACKYAYAYGTTENVNAHGTLNFTNISFEGEKFTQSVIPDKDDPATTKAPEVTTKAPTTQAPTTAAPAVKKLAKVTSVKAKNNKKKAITITWKKVKNAKTYQVKVGTKTYNTKKLKLTVKKLKKGKKYTVKVRAKAAGYTTGAWSKAVKVTIKK